MEEQALEGVASLKGVSETAIGAAMMRAQESLRADRLFDDPYAEAFVAAAPGAFANGPVGDTAEFADMVAAFSTDMVIRTKFYDDYLLDACARGCRQVVLLGAGLDARAFRLDWPEGVRLFELDRPEVLTFKDAVLGRQDAAPRCDRAAIAVDLRDDWADQLIHASFHPARHTAWLLEGLLPYLSDDDAARLLTMVGVLSSSGSQVSFEDDATGDDSPLARARAVAAMNELASLWQSGPNRPAPDWLRQHGWEVRTYDRESLAAMYQRSMPVSSTGGFLIATLAAPPG